MRITKLEIWNFRSINNLSIECSPLLTLLGPNNHGKSNVLSALEFGLTTSAKPVGQDFFAHRKTGDDELWVEMTFSELTEQEKHTFKRYVLSDGAICIRKTASLADEKVEVSYHGWVEEPEQEWLRTANAGDYTSRESVKKTPLVDLMPETGRLTKSHIEEAQHAYIEQNQSNLKFVRTLETGPLLGQKNVGGGVLPEFFLIPAVRDLTDELKIKATTTFGRLMNRAVREMAERDDRFIQAREQLETVISSLNQRDGNEETPNELAVLEKGIEKELSAWGVKVNIEVAPPEMEKLFELGTDIHLDDGVRTTADRKGHGLQRAMMFALLRSWAAALQLERQAKNTGEVRARRQSDSVIFAMEEPELFLHPHAQRRLSASLREISGTPEHQVFICTHSTNFIDLEYYKEVVIINKTDPVKGSEVRQCTEDLFEGGGIADKRKQFHMAQWINPDRGEMFFARRVVFVEGETEKVVIPYVAQRMGVLDPDVSIVDCGSKHNLPLYVTIAKAFSLPYLVVHDEDPLPEPIPEAWTQDTINSKRQTFALNETIASMVEGGLGEVVMMSADFETASGVSKSQGKKKGKPLAALDYFEELQVNDISEPVQALIQATYAPL
ncbi:MAG: ATP-dependent endonuclease [Rhodobiaceae bacterium]|nr:ATP-dependent endonuclease [Rhodobiaceae bacterium]